MKDLLSILKGKNRVELLERTQATLHNVGC